MIKNERIVIDITIIPPPKVIEKCIFINSTLDNSGYVLFKDGYYPHITLGMGCVSIDDLKDINNKIELVIKKMPELIINIIGYEGDNYFSFEVEKNNYINNLHNEIMNILKEYSHYGQATKDMFFEPDKIKENSGLIRWVNNFYTEHAFDKYDPHISLGEGDRLYIDFPFDFKVDSIVVFHLGVHGSCKEKISEFNFKK